MKTVNPKWLFCCLCFLVACSHDLKKTASGSYNVIYIFSDQECRFRAFNIINEIFNRTIMTPEQEKLFFVRWVDFDSLGFYADKRNLIFLADFNLDGEVSRWVVEKLEPQARSFVLDRKAWLFVKKDLFAKNQLVLFLISPTSTELVANIFLNADLLFRTVDSSVNERLSDFLFDSGFLGKENTKLMRKIEQNWGFSIRIPKFYELEKAESNFVWIRALKPERWVFVYFENSEDSSLSYSYWLEKRNFVGRAYYEGDIVLDSTVKVEKRELDGKLALRFSGLWLNKEEFIGGPFFSYLFYDEKTKRKYIVDGALFAPIIRKEPYIRHLEIIAQSFRATKK